jgi:hypothetical protein
MTHLPEIWTCLKTKLPRGQWVDLQAIYSIIESHLHLDLEDYEPQSPKSEIPKWMRNIRNVLQYRKGTGEVEWDGAGKYRL